MTLKDNNKALGIREELKASFSALNEEKDKKRAALRELFADNPKLLKQKGKEMRKTMHTERFKQHAPKINKLHQQLMETEAGQLATVQKDWKALYYIENPSEAVKLAAVQQNWEAIKYIKNPSEAVKLAAVQQNWEAIKYIKNPSIEALNLALEKKKEAENKK